MAAYVEALWDYGESSVVTHGIQVALTQFRVKLWEEMKMSENSCGRWSLTDTRFCHARGAEITIAEARSEEHSFGGVFPPEIVRILAGEAVQVDASQFTYKHPHNKCTCEAVCGHGCMDD
jgi:hypothetical protein